MCLVLCQRRERRAPRGGSARCRGRGTGNKGGENVRTRKRRAGSEAVGHEPPLRLLGAAAPPPLRHEPPLRLLGAAAPPPLIPATRRFHLQVTCFFCAWRDPALEDALESIAQLSLLTRIDLRSWIFVTGVLPSSVGAGTGVGSGCSHVAQVRRVARRRFPCRKPRPSRGRRCLWSKVRDESVELREEVV